jgi:hypothetical protein
MRCTKYETATGRVLAIFQAPDGLEDSQLEDGEAWIEWNDGHSIDLTYVIDGAAISRPAMNVVADKLEVVADGADVVTVTGIPIGAAVTIYGPSGVEGRHVVEDGELVFDAQEPGTFSFVFERFPERKTEIIIHAG